MAWHLIRHSFAMIFANLGQALKVSIIPYGILMIAAMVIFSISGLPMAGYDPSAVSSDSVSALTVLLLIALLVFAIFVFGWVAVSWHRFILKEEYTALIPAVAGRPIWPYVGRSMWLGFVVFLVAIPVMFVVGLIAAPFASGSLVIPLIAMLCGLTIVAYFWMRWAIALPATAIGEGMSLKEAWSATADVSGTIFGVSLMLMAINIVPAFLLAGVYTAAPILGFVVDVVLQWITIMVGLSILTTLYGHLIEGRPLVD